MTEAEQLVTRLAELIRAGKGTYLAECKREDIATVCRLLVTEPGALSGKETFEHLAIQILLHGLTRDDLGDERAVAIVRKAINATH